MATMILDFTDSEQTTRTSTQDFANELDDLLGNWFEGSGESATQEDISAEVCQAQTEITEQPTRKPPSEWTVDEILHELIQVQAQAYSVGVRVHDIFGRITELLRIGEKFSSPLPLVAPAAEPLVIEQLQPGLIKAFERMEAAGDLTFAPGGVAAPSRDAAVVSAPDDAVGDARSEAGDDFRAILGDFQDRCGPELWAKWLRQDVRSCQGLDIVQIGNLLSVDIQTKRDLCGYVNVLRGSFFDEESASAGILEAALRKDAELFASIWLKSSGPVVASPAGPVSDAAATAAPESPPFDGGTIPADRYPWRFSTHQGLLTIWQGMSISDIAIPEGARMKLTAFGVKNLAGLDIAIQQGDVGRIKGIGPKVVTKIEDAMRRVWDQQAKAAAAATKLNEVLSQPAFAAVELPAIASTPTPITTRSATAGLSASIQRVYDDAYKIGLAGKPNRNHYRTSTPQFVAWNEGWEQGMADGMKPKGEVTTAGDDAVAEPSPKSPVDSALAAGSIAQTMQDEDHDFSDLFDESDDVAPASEDEVAAYTAGCEAALAGEKVSANPHQRGSRIWYCWDRGWQDTDVEDEGVRE